MRASSFTLSSLYVLIPIVFVGWNLAGPARPDRTRWPVVTLTSLSNSSTVQSNASKLWKLDIPKLKQSINRLYSVEVLRKTGNSLRIACGQRLSWCIWGGRDPLMLFHAVEIWASEGIDAGDNRAIVNDAADRILDYGRRLKADGWTLIVLPVPTKLSIYKDLCRWPLLQKDPLSRRPVYEDRASEIYQHLLDRLATGGIAAVDLETIYQIHRNEDPKALLYPPGETHWSGDGIRVAAAAVADAITAQSGVERRHFIPSYLDVEDVGDIAAGFDPWPAWLGPLHRVYRYKDRLTNGEAGKGYIYEKEPTSLLVVAGTSYSGHYTWHVGQPVGFPWVVAGFLRKTEMHNRAVAGQGSFHPFRAFWANRQALEDDFALRHSLTTFPKILVWEFPVRDLASISSAEIPP